MTLILEMPSKSWISCTPNVENALSTQGRNTAWAWNVKQSRSVRTVLRLELSKFAVRLGLVKILLGSLVRLFYDFRKKLIMHSTSLILEHHRIGQRRPRRVQQGGTSMTFNGSSISLSEASLAFTLTNRSFAFGKPRLAFNKRCFALGNIDFASTQLQRLQPLLMYITFPLLWLQPRSLGLRPTALS